jgi:hypothetical protein
VRSGTSGYVSLIAIERREDMVSSLAESTAIKVELLIFVARESLLQLSFVGVLIGACDRKFHGAPVGVDRLMDM